ncbi:MAG: rhodanese-like domain-containing protein [Bacteroidota bacterium]
MANQRNNNLEEAACPISRWDLLKAQLNNLSPVAFRQMLEQSEDAILIDVRTPAEFATGHIEGAINIDYLGDGFWEKMETLPVEKTYFVYCRTHRRSTRACTLMANGGFDRSRIYNMNGGYSEWSKQFS